MRTVRVLFGVGVLVLGVAVCGVLSAPADTVTVATAAAQRPDDVPSVPPTPEPPANATTSTEGSKMSRFLDDVTSAFKQGTAKMKESLESAASSVKDGVLQGYDYVRSKFTGAPDTSTPATPLPVDGEESPVNGTAAPLTSAAPSTEPRPAISSPTTGQDGPALGGMVGVSNEPAHIVPNDDDDDDGRIIFNDKDYVTEAPVTTTVTVDNRFIIAGPLACKSGQEVVNGKCRNVF
uniref:Uncharacterized protein n=1 Tax=Anopheles dirus TaxID=7168 RepID=A0A182MZZ0_9DIPT